jgi:hypothetical protein
MTQQAVAQRSVLPVRDAQGNPLYRLSISTPVMAATAALASYNAVRERAADLLAARASDALQRRIEEIVVRDIMPEADLGLANETWLSPTLVANDWDAFIDQALPVTQLMAFYSIVDQTTPATITAVRFWSGTAQLYQQSQVERGYGFQESNEVIIRPTIIYDPNDTVNIDLYATAALAQVVVLGGFVAEAVGLTVSPPDLN